MHKTYENISTSVLHTRTQGNTIGIGTFKSSTLSHFDVRLCCDISLSKLQDKWGLLKLLFLSKGNSDYVGKLLHPHGFKAVENQQTGISLVAGLENKI